MFHCGVQFYIKDHVLISNAPVERWLGIVKNIVLDKQVNQKCSRVIRKIRSHVIFISKEVILDIRNRQCCRSVPLKRQVHVRPPDVTSEIDAGLLSEEKWNKKQRRSKVLNFYGKELKKFLENSNNELEIHNLRCVHCRLYNDEASVGPVDWLCCDQCNNCMHSICAKNIGLCISSNIYLSAVYASTVLHRNLKTQTTLNMVKTKQYVKPNNT